MLEDGDVATVTPQGVTVVGEDGAVRTPEIMHVDWDLAAAEKGGYDDFMLKEIFEQPKAVRETLRGRMGADGTIQLSELDMTPEQVRAIRRVYVDRVRDELPRRPRRQAPHREVGAHARRGRRVRASSATATRSSTRTRWSSRSRSPARRRTRSRGCARRARRARG